MEKSEYKFKDWTPENLLTFILGGSHNFLLNPRIISFCFYCVVIVTVAFANLSFNFFTKLKEKFCASVFLSVC